MYEGCLGRVEAVRYIMDKFCEKDSVTLEELRAEEAELIEKYKNYDAGIVITTRQVESLKHLEDVRKVIREFFA